MSRQRKQRCLRFQAKSHYFKPQGVPLRGLEEIDLMADELEALKLYEVDGLDQTEAAKEMGVSQPTFARIIGEAHRKTATAIVLGLAIKIEKNDQN